MVKKMCLMLGVANTARTLCTVSVNVGQGGFKASEKILMPF
jgi:hypothetical protein